MKYIDKAPDRIERSQYHRKNMNIMDENCDELLKGRRSCLDCPKDGSFEPFLVC